VTCAAIASGQPAPAEGLPELEPHRPIRDLADVNPENRALQSMAELTKSGYKRSLARELLQRAREMGDVKDTSPGGVSLRQQVLMTLEVEVERVNRQGIDRGRPETFDAPEADDDGGALRTPSTPFRRATRRAPRS
jgi:hypothetical protein